MEFEGEEVAAILKGAESLARAVTKVATALDGVVKEIARMGEKNAMFYAELIRAGAIAAEFAEPSKRYIITSSNAAILRNSFPNHKIQAIKTIREATGLGLKESKDLADNHWTVAGIEELLQIFRISV